MIYLLALLIFTATDNENFLKLLLSSFDLGMETWKSKLSTCEAGCLYF